MLEVTEKWQPHYPNAMKSWSTNWDVISPIFKFSSDVRKVIYTTNAIESLNSTYRRLNRQRSIFYGWYCTIKSFVFSYFWSYKEVEFAITKLG